MQNPSEQRRTMTMTLWPEQGAAIARVVMPRVNRNDHGMGQSYAIDGVIATQLFPDQSLLHARTAAYAARLENCPSARQQPFTWTR